MIYDLPLYFVLKFQLQTCVLKSVFIHCDIASRCASFILNLCSLFSEQQLSFFFA